jgi:FixJ family two-component response regulator
MASPDAFDVVVTDQTMPQMTGQELARKVHEARPDMPIVLCTGYSEQAEAYQPGETGIVCFLQKPVSIETLQEAVEQAARKQA